MTKKPFDIQVEGIEEVQKSLKRLQENIKNVGGEIPIDEILTPEFMTRNTKYSNIDEFIRASGLIPVDTEVITPEIWEAIPDEPWDEFVNNNSKFLNWEEMVGKGGEEYATKKVMEGI